jgi:hypothetical protein
MIGGIVPRKQLGQGLFIECAERYQNGVDRRTGAGLPLN